MSATYEGPEDRLRRYETLVASIPSLERKGATMPYTSRNGHMFSFLDKTGSMGLRLPTEARREFVDAYHTTIAEQYGRPMKEYVVVPDDLLDDPEELGRWLRISHDWIGTLKPKPTKR